MKVNVMKELINKMRYADTWSKNDLSKILAICNPTIGNEYFFRDLIYRAHEANLIKPISFPLITKAGSFSTPTNLSEHDFQYPRDSIIDWLSSKKGWSLLDEIHILEQDFATIEPDHPYFSFELDVAKIAQQWIIKNGNLKISKTIKQQITDYLKKHYPDLPNVAVQRIAVMVNPNNCKGGGKPRLEDMES